MVSEQSKLDILDKIAGQFGNTTRIIQQDSEDRRYGDILTYDSNIKRIEALPVPTEDWNFLTGLPHFVDHSEFSGRFILREEHITVVPTARFIVDSLWGKIKFSKKYFNFDGSLKDMKLKVMEKWYAFFLSDDVRRRWLSDLKEQKPVEVFRTFNHETKEVKAYFGTLRGSYLANFIKDDGDNIIYRNSLFVHDKLNNKYVPVCSRLFIGKSGRIFVHMNNDTDEFVQFINKHCYTYGLGYLKTPLQTRGGRKISSLQIHL